MTDHKTSKKNYQLLTYNQDYFFDIAWAIDIGHSIHKHFDRH